MQKNIRIKVGLMIYPKILKHQGYLFYHHCMRLPKHFNSAISYKIHVFPQIVVEPLTY